MKIYDVSRPIKVDMAVYKDRDFKRPSWRIDARYKDTGVNESSLLMNLHTGTHVAAPFHMVDETRTIDEIDIDLYMGRCRLIDLSDIEEFIHKSDLEPYDIHEGERIIIRTRNSYSDVFDPNFVYIEEDAAQYLRDIGIKTLGIDAMSIERGKKDHPTHSIILGAGIGVIEDMRLKDVPVGEYELRALPLRLVGAEASPVRAVLVEL